MIVFLGPDGSGKSSVIKALSQSIENTVRFHLKPDLFRGAKNTQGAVTEPHAKPTYGIFTSILKIFYYLLEYSLGYHIKVKTLIGQSKLVLFDRYFHDVLVDPRRYRYGGPIWLVRWISRLIPQPDLFILLDAPAEIFHARVQEVHFSETKAQRERYLELINKLSNGIIVNVAQPLEDVVSYVRETILEHRDFS